MAFRSYGTGGSDQNCHLYRATIPDTNSKKSYLFWLLDVPASYASEPVILAEPWSTNPTYLYFTTDAPPILKVGSMVSGSAGTKTFAAGAWHHVAWTRDAGANKLYVDGAWDVDLSRTPSGTCAGLAVCNYDPDSSSTYDANVRLAHLKVWDDCVLTEAEIATEMRTARPLLQLSKLWLWSPMMGLGDPRTSPPSDLSGQAHALSVGNMQYTPQVYEDGPATVPWGGPVSDYWGPKERAFARGVGLNPGGVD